MQQGVGGFERQGLGLGQGLAFLPWKRCSCEEGLGCSRRGGFGMQQGGRVCKANLRQGLGLGR